MLINRRLFLKTTLPLVALGGSTKKNDRCVGGKLYKRRSAKTCSAKCSTDYRSLSHKM